MNLPEERNTICVNEDHSLSITSAALSQPSDDNVLIKVCGIGVNRGDLLQRRGLYPPPADASPILGLEVSGTIVAIGPNVTQWQVGDEVCALTHGAGYCNYTIVPEHQCLPIPSSVSLLDAAALPEACITAWHNLFQRCHLKPNESCLIHGGASGIGTMAIQMATAMGAKVYTTAGSEDKCKTCEALGATQAINYQTTDFEVLLREKEPQGIDVILDMAGGDFIQKNINIASIEGRICSIAFVRGITAEINFANVLLKRLTLTASTLRAQSFQQKAQMITELKTAIWPKIADGTIKPIIDSVFSFEEIEAAHQYMESGQHTGKILLEVFH